MKASQQNRISAQGLAYWYLRLNGFLTITNFVVHPDRGNLQETEADILGIRFPYRAENLVRPMPDDSVFSRIRDKSYIAIVEVATSECKLNGPWTKPERQNMLRVLRAIGAFPPKETSIIAESLYERGTYRSQLYHVGLLCLGARVNPDVVESRPEVEQILWEQVLQFIHRRFAGYLNEKRSHSQWDNDGHFLWDTFLKSKDDVDGFKSKVRIG